MVENVGHAHTRWVTSDSGVVCYEYITRILNRESSDFTQMRLQLVVEGEATEYYFNITLNESSLVRTTINATRNNIVTQIPLETNITLDPFESRFLSFLVCDQSLTQYNITIKVPINGRLQTVYPDINKTLPYRDVEKMGLDYATWHWTENGLSCEEVIVRVRNKPKPRTKQASVQISIIDEADSNRMNVYSGVDLTHLKFTPRTMDVSRIPSNSNMTLYTSESAFFSFVACSPLDEVRRYEVIVWQIDVWLDETQIKPPVQYNVPLPLRELNSSGHAHARWDWPVREGDRVSCQEVISRVMNGRALSNYDSLSLELAVRGRLEGEFFRLDNSERFTITLAESPSSDTVPLNESSLIRTNATQSSNTFRVTEIPLETNITLDPFESQFLSFLVCDQSLTQYNITIKVPINGRLQTVCPDINKTLPYRDVEKMGLDYATWHWTENGLSCEDVIVRVRNKPKPRTKQASVQISIIDEADSNRTNVYSGAFDLTHLKFTPQTMVVSRIPPNSNMTLFTSESAFFSFVACSPLDEVRRYEVIDWQIDVWLDETQIKPPVQYNVPLPLRELNSSGHAHARWDWPVREGDRVSCQEVISRVMNGRALSNYDSLSLELAVRGRLEGEFFRLDNSERFTITLQAESESSDTTAPIVLTSTTDPSSTGSFFSAITVPSFSVISDPSFSTITSPLSSPIPTATTNTGPPPLVTTSPSPSATTAGLSTDSLQPSVESGLTGGGIAGIVIASIIFFLISSILLVTVCCVVRMCCRHRRQQRTVGVANVPLRQF